MKKLGITTLAVLYAVLVFSTSAERTYVWATQAAQNLAHPSGDTHSPELQRATQSDAYISQKKIVETEFVVELPREAVLFQNHFDRYIPGSSFEYRTSQNGRPSSSRSPPLA